MALCPNCGKNIESVEFSLYAFGEIKVSEDRKSIEHGDTLKPDWDSMESYCPLCHQVIEMLDTVYDFFGIDIPSTSAVPEVMKMEED